MRKDFGHTDLVHPVTLLNELNQGREEIPCRDILIMPPAPSSRMPRNKKRTKKRPEPLIDLLPGLLVKALVCGDDFIMTCETDPDTEKKKIHVITGKFISDCMLQKLLGKAEAQRDEGSSVTTRDWA